MAGQDIDQQHFAARRGDRDPRRHDARVVDDEKLALDLVRQVRKAAVADVAARAVVDEQPRPVAALRRLLRDQFGRQRPI